MIRSLSLSERQLALALSVGLTVLGLAMAAAARQGPMAVHGGMAMALGIVLVFAVGGAHYDADAPVDRAGRYYDTPTAFGIGIQSFRPPSQVQALAPDQTETVRIGGMVEAGSLHRQGTRVRFRVTDGQLAIAVRYSGITPDLFAEGEGVIATGRMVADGFDSTEILAKHDESYMPRELADMDLDR